MKTQRTKLAFTLTAATLAACGGGGGTTSTTTGLILPVAVGFSATCANGSTQSSTVSTADAQSKCPATSGPSASPGVAIVTSVPASTYSAGSEELAAFNLLNSERAACGFGLLAQNPKLDQAAQAHANWLLINNYGGHIEAATVPMGFTGVAPWDRAAAAGYAWASIGETLVTSNTPSIAGFGTSATRSLLSAPYHLFGQMAGNLDVGMAVRSITQVTPLVANGATQRVAINDFGVPSTGGDFQVPAANAVLTYPCQGTTGVNYRVTGESPNPVPGRDLAASPLGGPVLVMVKRGQALSVTSASMTNLATGLPVVLRAPLTAANDPNHELAATDTYLALVIPDVPLVPSTAYQVNLAGTNNGTVFSRTFTFTTGTGG